MWTCKSPKTVKEGNYFVRFSIYKEHSGSSVDQFQEVEIRGKIGQKAFAVKWRWLNCE